MHHADAAFDAEKTYVLQTLLQHADLSALAAMPAAGARSEVEAMTLDIVKSGAGLSETEQARIASEVCDELLGFGPLEPLLARDDVTDILVNGFGECYLEAGGVMEKAPLRFASRDQFMNICRRIAAQAGRRIDEASPFCDARLPSGARANIVWPPLAVDGPLLTIRKFRSEPFTLDSMAAAGAMTNDAAALLKIAVKSRCNILLTGGAGSGKTTLLNALAGCASASDRIVVCEDAAELRLDHRHTVRLETRTPNFEGKGGVCMAALIKNTLRMRPDRIIVGEVRGAEAFDLLQALNTGHDGSMGTLHANNPAQALPRLEAMAMMGAPGVSESAIRRLVYGGLDVIVHLTRTAAGRRVQSIASVTDGGVTPLLSEHGRITVTERLTQRADEQGLGSSLAELAG